MDVTLLSELGTPPPPRPSNFGISANEYAEKMGFSREVALRLLEKGVADGTLTRVLMTAPGSPRVMVYCRPTEWPPKV